MRDKTNDKPNTQNDAIKLFVLTSLSNERPSKDITHVCVHSSVQEVFGKEFENMKQLEHLHFCQGVQSIGPKAFKDCSSLKTVSMASSVQSIGYRSFYFTSLMSIDLSKGSLQTIGFCAFGHCRFLQTVKLPTCLKKIEDWAFSHCVALLGISIPEGVQIIGRLAFLNCSSLRQIAIPSSVESLGEWCFQDCSSLSQVTLEPTTKRSEIAMGTFANCQALQHCFIPSGMQVVGSDAFRDCTSLVSVDLPKGDSLKYIQAKAFYGCQSLCAMSIPSSTVGIGDRAFYGCASLVGVELLQSKNLEFGSEAFAHCPNLVNIALCTPSSPDKEVPQDLFAGCSKLRVKEAEGGIEETDEPTTTANPYLPALQDRFVNLPVHEACYHSSTTTTDDLRARIFGHEASSPSPEDDDDDKISSPVGLQDSLGMTPFHLLATSTTPRTDLLQVLLEHYPLDVLSHKDSSNRTMMDYLVQDQRPTALALMQRVLRTTIVDGMTSWGRPCWRSTMDATIGSLSNHHWENNQDNKAAKRQALQKVHGQLELFARCEVLSLLDLAVWKTNMDAIDKAFTTKESFGPMDRENSRLLCGATIVKSKVLDYLICCNEDDTSKPRIFVSPSIFPFNVSWMNDMSSNM